MWSIHCYSVARTLACHLKKCRKNRGNKVTNIIPNINEYGPTKNEHNFKKEKAIEKKSLIKSFSQDPNRNLQ